MRRATVVIIILSAALLLQSCGSGVDPGLQLRGNVTRFGTGAPVPGATIQLLPAGLSVATNSGGSYQFQQLDNEVLETATFSAQGYRTVTIDLIPGAPSLDAALSFVGQGQVFGLVSDVEGQPVVGARIEVSGEPRSGVTNQAGHYLLYGAPGGLQVLSVGALGYATQSSQISVRNDEEIAINFTLDRSNARSALKGLITDMISAEPIVGATITFGTRRGVTDQNGVFTFFEMREGTIIPTVSAPGYRTSIAGTPLEIKAGENSYNISLLPDTFVDPPPPF